MIVIMIVNGSTLIAEKSDMCTKKCKNMFVVATNNNEVQLVPPPFLSKGCGETKFKIDADIEYIVKNENVIKAYKEAVDNFYNYKEPTESTSKDQAGES